MIYRFENFEFDTYRMELRRAGDVVPVEPQVFSLLELLIAHHDRVVTKDEINQIVWGGRFVSDSALSSRIKLVRKALQDDGVQQRLIKTVHNRGFRFIAVPDTDTTGLNTSDISKIKEANDLLSEQLTDKESLAGTYVRDRPTIAVLPFEPLGAGIEFTGFAKAVSHELILELSRLRWLYVIARGSSFRFDSSNQDLSLVRRSLGADYLLSGSVEVQGNKSYVNIEMSGADEDRVIWADRYQGTTDDLIALRQRIAGQVLSAIEVRVPLEEASRMSSIATENLGAWSAYHRGLTHMYRFNKHDNSIAAALFQRAIEADPTFARAYSGLSFTHFQNSFLNFVSDGKAERELARKMAEKSFEIDPLDPFVSLTMGRSNMLLGDIEGSINWFERSINLSPNYAFAKYNLGLASVVNGDSRVGEVNLRAALLLSPLDPLRYGMLSGGGMAHMIRGEYKEAAELCGRAANEPHAHIHIRAIAAIANHLADNHKEAEKWAQKVKAAKSGDYQSQFFRCFPFRDEETVKIIKIAFKKLLM